MANYIVNNSKFNPFSYNELMAPVAMADTAHKELESNMGDLATNAGKWSGLINPDTESDVYNTYKNYNSDLTNSVSQLALEGLTPNSRLNLINMKQRYTLEITPIEVAYATRAKLAQEQLELMAKDLTMKFNRKASNTGLGDYIKNPTLGYLNVSGAILTSLVANQAKALASLARDNPQEFKKIYGGDYFLIISKTGYNEKEITKAMNQAPDADPVLSGIVSNVMNASGVHKWNDPLAEQELRLIASTGLMQAIGDTKYKELDNWRAQLNLKEYYRKKAEAKVADTPLYYDPVSKKTTVSGGSTTQIKLKIDLLDKIMKDPSLLNKLELKSGAYTSLNSPGGFGYTNYQGKNVYHKPNQEFINDLRTKYGTSNLPQLRNALLEDIKKSTVRDFSYKMKITDPKLIKEQILGNANISSTEMKPIIDGEVSSRVLKKSDLINRFHSNLEIVFDPDNGYIINSYDKDGKPQLTLIDPQLIEIYDKDGVGVFQDAKNQFDNALKSGNITGNKGTNLTLLDIFLVLHHKYNTIPKRLSETNSKED